MFQLPVTSHPVVFRNFTKQCDFLTIVNFTVIVRPWTQSNVGIWISNVKAWWYYTLQFSCWSLAWNYSPLMRITSETVRLPERPNDDGIYRISKKMLTRGRVSSIIRSKVFWSAPSFLLVSSTRSACLRASRLLLLEFLGMLVAFIYWCVFVMCCHSPVCIFLSRWQRGYELWPAIWQQGSGLCCDKF